MNLKVRFSLRLWLGSLILKLIKREIVMEIIEGNDKILSSVAEEVPFGDDVKGLVSEMWKVLHGHPRAVGLAADQVGILRRVILVKDNGFVSEIINPVITRTSGKDKQSKEGCLSYPGKIEAMRRRSWVVVEGYDIDWKPIKKKCRGLLSYIIQHEIDHLNGTTIKNHKEI